MEFFAYVGSTSGAPMPSPFPGIDPFIESSNRWNDFHHGMLVAMRTQMNAGLPPEFIARLGTRVQMTAEDVPPSANSKALSTASHMNGPHRLPQDMGAPGAYEQLFIDVLHVPRQRTVAHVEMLCPPNKAGCNDRTAYLATRRDLVHHGVNLVEIDLLLQGERLPMLAPLPRGNYYAFVTRSVSPSNCDIYSWSIRDPLPVVPVPIDDEGREIGLNVAAAFSDTYEHGRYDRVLQYDTPPSFLNAEDQEWVAKVFSESYRSTER